MTELVEEKGETHRSPQHCPLENGCWWPRSATVFLGPQQAQAPQHPNPISIYTTQKDWLRKKAKQPG